MNGQPPEPRRPSGCAIAVLIFLALLFVASGTCLVMLNSIGGGS